MRSKYFFVALLFFLFPVLFLSVGRLRAVQGLLDRFGEGRNVAQLPAESASARNGYRFDETVAKSLKLAPEETAPKRREPADFWAELDEAIAPYLAQFEANYAQFADDLLRYGEIEIVGNKRLTREQVLEAAGASGKGFWEAVPEKLEQQLENTPWIESARVSVAVYPIRVRVEVQETEPWIVAHYEGRSWLVSRSGKLIQTLDGLASGALIVESSSLPRLTGMDFQPKEKSLLSSPNARFVYAVRLLHLLEDKRILPFQLELATLTAEGDLLLLPLDTSRFPEVLLSAEALEQGDTARELRLVLADSRARGERVKRVDLRFADQAIVR